jgi:zinc protease
VRLRVLPETPLSAAATTVDRNIMPPPSKEPAFTPPLPVRDRLPNGMGVTVVEQHGMPIVAFGVLLGSGAAADPSNLSGLAGMVGDMLPEGAAGKSSQQIANDFEFIGARLSADSRREYSLVSTETLTKHWGDALEMMAEVILSPDFPQHELDRVRRERLTDLRRSKDEPNAIAERLLAGLVYPAGSGYAHSIAGTEESVQAITRDDLVSQFRRAYRPDNAHLLVVGDVEREEVMRRAAAVLGAWNGSGPDGVAGGGDLTDSPATIYLVDRPGAPQSVIRATHSLVPRRHPDYFPLLLANYSFGGQFSARLNQNLRQDKGYSYGYMSSIQWHRRPSALVAGGSVQSNATKESVYETLKEFREVSGERPITAEELSNAKDGLLRAYPASFERPASVLGQLVAMEQFGLSDDYFRTVRPSVEAVSLDDVHLAVQAHIRPGNLQILVVGDRASVEAPLSELGLPLVHLTEDGDRTT